MDAGTRLGPYEVVSRLGAGGMGEVYRARDTRLDRHVALKILPEKVAQREDLRLRFEREARAISALNHPNICTLYDVGIEGNVSYLVMELLEGETLADVIARGPLPLDRALRYAIDIATALERAHRQGIIHRDLKPGNVMITKSGLKLLDFGLARVQAPSRATHDATTMLSPATSAGMILGTLEYMSPEQLEGAADIDSRTDIFSLGCIVYEMLAGKRPFSGSSPASLITSIMSSEPPPIASVVPLTPPALDRLVRKCLAKNRDDRWQNAGDLASELRWLLEEPAATRVTSGRSASKWPWLIAAIALLAATVAAFFALRSAPPHGVQLAMPLVGELENSIMKHEFAVSPDGRHVAYCAMKGDTPWLFIRSMSDGTVVSVPSSEEAEFVFWSPDSTQVGFATRHQLMRMPIGAQEPVTICERHPGAIFTADWGTDGTIVYAEAQERSSLFRVPAAGGEPQRIHIDVPNAALLWPKFLDEKRVAYMSVKVGDDLTLYIRNLATNENKEIGKIEGHFDLIGDTMLFVRDASLYAQHVDKDLHRKGQPVLLATPVWNYSTLGAAAFSASANTILYAGAERDAHLTFYDANGNATVIGPAGVSGMPRLSRDGRMAATSVIDLQRGTGDIWTCDTARGSATQLTSTPFNESWPTWSPDGRRIAFSGEAGGPPHLFVAPSTGGEPTEILPIGRIQYTSDWSPDGKWIALSYIDPKTRGDIVFAEPKPHGAVISWLATPFNERFARFSPDSQWVAYSSDASGKAEVYVARVSDPADRYQVSTGGGRAAAWRADGKELYYETDDRKIYSVAIRSWSPFDAAPPQLRVQSAEGRWETGFDVTPDGQKFLVNRVMNGPTTRPLNVILNWHELAEKR